MQRRSRGCLYVSIRTYITLYVSIVVYVCLKWSICVLKGPGQNFVLFAIFLVLYRECCGFCVGVVRTLFGLSLGMFGCTQEKSEESPNKVNSDIGRNVERDGRFFIMKQCKKYFTLLCVSELF
jgi:hypothetical protein